MFSIAFVHLFNTENLKESGMEERGEEKGRESAEWKRMKGGGRRDSIGCVNPCDFLKTVFCLLEWRANEGLRFVHLCQY